MALGSGISYRDWVSLSTISSNITLSSTNVVLMPLDNVANPRPKSIARLETDTIATDQVVLFELQMTSTTTGNEFDGKVGMTIGCVGLINHNIPLDRDASVIIVLYDADDVEIYGITSVSANREFENGSLYFLMDQVYEEVFKVQFYVAVDGVFDELDVGRVWMGNYIETCFDNGYSMTHGYAAKPKYSIGNDIHLRYKTPRKEMNFNFTLIENDVVYGAGIDSWYDFSRWASTNRDLIVLPNIANDSEKQYLGTYGILKRPMNIQKISGSYWSADFDVIELV